MTDRKDGSDRPIPATDQDREDSTAGKAAPETDDSPKRQGDKLEQARDAAAGKPARSD